MWEAAIVGGGPAGLAAAMHLCRGGYRTVLAEKDRLGGEARRLGRIENYPGFPLGVSGSRLTELMVRQALSWGLQTVHGEVVDCRRGAGRFRLRLQGGRVLCARTVVYCPGARFAELGLPEESRFRGRGLRHAAFGEAAFWRGRSVAVAGGGEAAAHQALALALHARQVYLLCRGDKIKAHRLLLDRLNGAPRVVKLWGASVRRLHGRGRLEAVEIKNRQGCAKLKIDALFVLIGKTSSRLPCSKDRGFFVAGDASGHSFRQVAVACGEGMRAAMRCMSFLEDQR